MHELQKAQIPIYAGVDWGFTHDSVIVIAANLPNGEVWILDCFAAPGLEFVDVLENAKGYRDKYGIQKWFCKSSRNMCLVSTILINVRIEFHQQLRTNITKINKRYNFLEGKDI